MELLEEAYVEHASAKDLIAQVEAASEVDGTFSRTQGQGAARRSR
jgi:hypothetical protein